MFKDIVTSAQLLAQDNPELQLITFLQDGEDKTVSISCQALDRSARQIGKNLYHRGMQGERIIIALPSGIDYAIALLGCFYAGAYPVPVLPANRISEWNSTQRIAQNCSARLGIASASEQLPSLSIDHWEWCNVPSLLVEHSAEFDPIQPNPEDIAFLQYTSGSTATPKGVCITHGNLAANSWQISAVRAHQPYVGVIWLPPYHDMGLVGGILHGFFTGCPVVLMSPLHFLQNPLRWLRAISHYRGTLSAAPDFAFRFCVERIAPEKRVGLDLSSWEIAYCGAEPVREKTLNLFTAAYEPYGFRREAFLPCYGLAEATLMVSGKTWDQPPQTIHVHRGSLNTGGIIECQPDAPDAVALVSCGPPVEQMEIKIVSLDGGEPLAEGEVGEVQIRGPNVTPGYWSDLVTGSLSPKPATHSLTNAENWQTGDLGFLYNRELFITGRRKNLILIRGRNHQAEDLEQTASESHALIASGGCAAIAVDHGTAEALYLLIEIDTRHPNSVHHSILEVVRTAIVKVHGVLPARILLVRRGVLPRTSSGKLRRQTCRDLLLNDALPVMAEWEV